MILSILAMQECDTQSYAFWKSIQAIERSSHFTAALSLIALSIISASKHTHLLLCIALCSCDRIPCSSTCWYSLLARVAVITLYTLSGDGSPLHPGFGINTVCPNTSLMTFCMLPYNVFYRLVSCHWLSSAGKKHCKDDAFSKI